jgi:hypothetical protein
MGVMDNIKSFFGYPMQSAAQPLNTEVPSVATTAGSKKLLKVAGEKKGYTMAGGKRLTRRRKSSKKTHKRKH